MDEYFTFTNKAGNRLAAIIGFSEKPNNTAVILLHCFTCTKHHRIIRSISDALVIAGFTTLRFDFSGNGESQGKLEDATYTKMIDEVRKAVTIFSKRGFEKIFVGGHSLGAMIALLSSHIDERISGTIFIAGSSEAARVRQVFQKEVVEKAELEGQAIGHVYNRDIILKREFLLDLRKYDVKIAAETLKRPILILHGTGDEVISFHHAEQLYKWCTQPKKLVLIEGADHLFKDQKAIKNLGEAIEEWLEENKWAKNPYGKA